MPPPLAILNENEEPCPVCEGEGKTKCYDCNGIGTRILSAQESPHNVITKVACSMCEGGRVQCPRCKGLGKIQKKSSAEQVDDSHAPSETFSANEDDSDHEGECHFHPGEPPCDNR